MADDAAAATAAAAARAAAAAGGAGSGASGADGRGGERRVADGADQAAAAAAAARAAAEAAARAADQGRDAEGWATGKWRENYAGEDQTKLGVLKRYDSPKAALDALFAARQRIDSGELKAKLPDNATPEQIAQYHKDNGIPEKPEGYWEGLKPEVLAEIDDGDRALLNPFLEYAHKQHIPPAVLHGFIALRQAEAERYVEQQVANDLKIKQSTEDNLRADWGKDYRTNIGVIHAVLESAPEEVKNALMSARTPDGYGLFATPEANKWFAQLGRNLVDVGVIIPGGDGGDEGGRSIDARIKEIAGWMGAANGSADYKKYWSDAAVQTEYRDLLDRQAAITKRRAA